MRILVRCTLFVLLLCNAHAGFSQTQIAKILKTLNLPYTMMADSTYKVFIDLGVEASVIMLRQVELPANAGNVLKLTFVIARICDARENLENPPAQLKKIAEVNGRLVIGKLSIDSDNGAVYYTSQLWPSSLNASTLALEIGVAAQIGMELREMLCSF